MRERKAPLGEFLRTNASPMMLFCAGIALFPVLLLQRDMVIRSLQILLFILLDALSGRRIRLVQFVVVAAGIVACNLFPATGRVLVSLPLLPVTEGALKIGLLKATAVTGLIALSRFSIRSDLRLPGSIGGLIGRSFYYFERIMGERHRIDRKDIIGSIDGLFLEIQAAAVTGTESAPSVAPGDIHSVAPGDIHSVAPGDIHFSSRPTFRGALVLVLIVAANWGVYAATILLPRPFWGG